MYLYSHHFVFRKTISVSARLVLIAAAILAPVCGSASSDDSVLTYSGDEKCRPSQCIQTHQQLICDDCIPINVPSTVNEIILDSFHGSHLMAHGFCKVSWTNVTILSIYNELDDWSAKRIVDYAFDCLHKIETLKLSIAELSNITVNTFYGLSNVRSLHLIDCSRLETPALSTALSLNTVLPRLNKLILRNMGSDFSGTQMSQNFIDVLALRNITELNLSSSYVLFVNIPYGRLCETLQVLNVSKTRILHSSGLPHCPCESLQVVDFSGAQFPRSQFMKNNITFEDNVVRFDKNIKFYFFRHVPVMYLNGMVSLDHYFYFKNTTFAFSVNNSASEFHVCGYNMPIFELELIFQPDYITYLDLSNNRIERIGKNTLRNLKHLLTLDLSKNQLGIASKDTLGVLFRNNTKLMNVNLAYNELTILPLKVFEFNTKLKQLNLKGNKLTQIYFQISNLSYLMYMDLRDNLIEYLDASSRHQLDNLFNNQQTRATAKENGSFVVDMRSNPLSCKCNFLDFIVWFANSPIFKNSETYYYCTLDGQRISMDSKAIAMSKYDCGKSARKLRKVLISTLLPSITLTIAIVGSILLFKRYRKFKKRERLRRNIAQIVDETLDYRFPVFLSYASVDCQFVDEHVHQPLKVGLLTDKQ